MLFSGISIVAYGRICDTGIHFFPFERTVGSTAVRPKLPKHNSGIFPLKQAMEFPKHALVSLTRKDIFSKIGHLQVWNNFDAIWCNFDAIWCNFEVEIWSNLMQFEAILK